MDQFNVTKPVSLQKGFIRIPVLISLKCSALLQSLPPYALFLLLWYPTSGLYNAFLNGILNETVYMSQHPGFKNPSFPDHVCNLHKAIYGLKQPPQAWNDQLKLFLLECGFHNSRLDTSLFYLQKGSQMVILLIYVDDLIVTGNDLSLITRLISVMNQKFTLKDLGPLDYFVGIQITHLPTGIHLHQSKYISNLLGKLNLQNVKSCPSLAVLTITCQFLMEFLSPILSNIEAFFGLCNIFLTRGWTSHSL